MTQKQRQQKKQKKKSVLQKYVLKKLKNESVGGENLVV